MWLLHMWENYCSENYKICEIMKIIMRISIAFGWYFIYKRKMTFTCSSIWIFNIWSWWKNNPWFFSAFFVNDSHCSAPSSSPHSSPVDASMLTDFSSGELNDAIRTYIHCKKLNFSLISDFFFLIHCKKFR